MIGSPTSLIIGTLHLILQVLLKMILNIFVMLMEWEEELKIRGACMAFANLRAYKPYS